ncbi:MAG: hypothetical protein AAGA09_03240 [Pseudomonadota bacterium]
MPAAPFSIRFTDEERARLRRDAGALSLAAYIRLKLFCDGKPDGSKRNATRKRNAPSVELTMISQLLGALGQSRLSSNLNQIAKAANVGALPVSPELESELQAACADVRAMRETLIVALGLKSEA